MKNSNFYGEKAYPKFEFLVQLWPQFAPWRWPKSKIAIRLSKSVKVKALSPFNFQWKLWLTFVLFVLFWGYKWAHGQNSCGTSLNLHHVFKMPFIEASCCNFGLSSFQTHVIPFLVLFLHFLTFFYRFFTYF